jgi:hypothetical protein
MFSICSEQGGHRAMSGYLQFKVVRTSGHEEIVARTNNLLVGRAAFETARRLYPNERVDYRDGTRIIARSEPEKSFGGQAVTVRAPRPGSQ